jgi:hypothetical protein
MISTILSYSSTQQQQQNQINMKQALFNHMRKLGLILTQSELREIELKCKRIIAERTSSNPMLHLLSEHLSDQHSLYLPYEDETLLSEIVAICDTKAD